MPKAFLAHSSKDKPFVRKLKSALKSAGIEVFVDEDEILPGQRLRAKIGQLIKDSDCFLVVISQNSVDSPWVKEELNVAAQELTGTLIPILYRKSTMPPYLTYLSDLRWVKFTHHTHWGPNLKQLVAAILGQQRTNIPERAIQVEAIAEPLPGEGTRELDSAIEQTLKEERVSEYHRLFLADFAEKLCSPTDWAYLNPFQCEIALSRPLVMLLTTWQRPMTQVADFESLDSLFFSSLFPNEPFIPTYEKTRLAGTSPENFRQYLDERDKRYYRGYHICVVIVTGEFSKRICSRLKRESYEQKEITYSFGTLTAWYLPAHRWASLQKRIRHGQPMIFLSISNSTAAYRSAVHKLFEFVREELPQLVRGVDSNSTAHQQLVKYCAV